MLTVEVISPEQVVHQTQGVEVVLPTSVGYLGIRTGHRPMLAELVPGTLVIKKENGKEETLATFGGFVEVFQNTIYVMTDSAELADKMDELKIQEAMSRADTLKKEAKDVGELKAASALMAANLLRMKAVRRQRGSGNRPPKA
jgi:F-type H+-transporting ATPase subunit epsilon